MKHRPTAVIVFLIATLTVWSQNKAVTIKNLSEQPIDSCLNWLRANAYNDYDFEVYHAVGLETLKRSLTY